MNWYSRQFQTDGHLTIDGNVRASRLECGFSREYFFFFPIKALENSNTSYSTGPYFSLRVPVLEPLVESDLSILQSRQGATFLNDGDTLGEMELNWGRMAMDCGEGRRQILRIEIGFRLVEHIYRITVSGKTGPIDPATINEGEEPNTGPVTFAAWMLLEPIHIETALLGHPLQERLRDRMS